MRSVRTFEVERYQNFDLNPENSAYLCSPHNGPNICVSTWIPRENLADYLQLKRVDFPEHPSDRSVSARDEESQGGQPPEHLEPEEDFAEMILRCERRQNSVKTRTDSLEQLDRRIGWIL